MKKFWLQIAALLIITFTAMYASLNPSALNSFLSTGSLPKANNSIPTSPTQKQISIVSATGRTKANLKVEIADTQPTRALGLGERNSLDPNSGMLFLLDSPTMPHFWMKGMHFALDMIWINGDNIVGSEVNIPPPSGSANDTLPIYSPTINIDKVLEVNAGFVAAHGIVIGDKLQQAQ